MSLADELLADLEDAGEDITDELQETDQTKLEDTADEVEDVSMHVDSEKLNSIHSIAKLRDSKQVFNNALLVHEGKYVQCDKNQAQAIRTGPYG